jgi:hypothetical protein
LNGKLEIKKRNSKKNKNRKNQQTIKIKIKKKSGEKKQAKQAHARKLFLSSPKVQARVFLKHLVCCALPYLPLGT